MDINMTENNSWALKIFLDFCCDGCSCKSENAHTTDKDLGASWTSQGFAVEDEHTFEQPQ